MKFKPIVLALCGVAIFAMLYKLVCAPVTRGSVENEFTRKDFPEAEMQLRKFLDAPTGLSWGPIGDRPRTTEVNFGAPFTKVVGVELYRQARLANMTYEVCVGYGGVKYTKLTIKGSPQDGYRDERDALDTLKLSPKLSAAFGRTGSATYLGETFYLGMYGTGAEVSCTIYSPK